MKATYLTINDWQDWIAKFRAAKPNAKPGAAMRIENTPFTTARYYGGMIYNGDKYTYFEPRDERQPPNRDGTPYVAWLMVRTDFLRWVTAQLKKEAKGGAK
jgi:hypothetical protein